MRSTSRISKSIITSAFGLSLELISFSMLTINADGSCNLQISTTDMGQGSDTAMAQIAGYALGGCWTHIGCAQSVVAYAFIQRDVDERYTPVQWIRDMTPVILTTLVALTALIYVENLLF